MFSVLSERKQQAQTLLDPMIVLQSLIDGHHKLNNMSTGPCDISKTRVDYINMSDGKILLDLTHDGSGSYKNDGTHRWNKRHNKTFKCVRPKYVVKCHVLQYPLNLFVW